MVLKKKGQNSDPSWALGEQWEGSPGQVNQCLSDVEVVLMEIWSLGCKTVVFCPISSTSPYGCLDSFAWGSQRPKPAETLS